MATGEIPVEFLMNSDRIFAIADIAPQAPIHILIIPKIHQESAAGLAGSDPQLLAEMFKVSGELAKTYGLDGYRSVFNTGESAGQSVFHAHLHLLGGRPFAWPPG